MTIKFKYGLSAALLGATIATVQMQNAVAQSAEQVNKIAEQITVLIEGEQNQGQGSGIIIAREGSTYYVLTAKHVIERGGEFKIVTPDRNSFRVESSNIIQLPGVDLAIAPFVSSGNYEIAQLGDSKTVNVGEQVYVSGWPKPGETITRQIRQMTAGQISARERVNDGYELIYTNPTRQGMSGGPILDVRGRVIGIHGRTDANREDTIAKAWVNLGIPIDTFVQLAPKAYAEQGKEKLKRQNYQGAIADFSQGLRFNQNSADVFNGLAYANFAQKNYKAALENAIKAIQNNAQLADAYRVRGASNAQLGNHKEAIADFDRAIQINSNFADAYGLRGVSRAQIKDYIGANTDIAKAIGLAPNSAVGYNRRSEVRRIVGDNEGANEDAQKAASLDGGLGNQDGFQMALNSGLGISLPRNEQVARVQPQPVQQPVRNVPQPRPAPNNSLEAKQPTAAPAPTPEPRSQPAPVAVRQATSPGAESAIQALIRGQQTFRTRNGAFTGTVSLLQRSFNIQLPMSKFNFAIHTTTRGAYHYAIPVNPAQKAYVGAVFLTETATNSNPVTVSIVCETDEASNIRPPDPLYVQGQPVCRPGTSPVGASSLQSGNSEPLTNNPPVAEREW
ncbi:trypsin-like peptidase domain-containing protein [Tychonema sp. LEGE 07203]|uniref:trypsin-like peptidase domain-containing protein n=1 Tax=Tychonema sp. LEGE 07203 TaxID=1828671 RepID=UPI001881DE04|nr:trypsin-like peptidase domain-containing protein [Tychonema sp. LEGE 07203]MBE9095022.1 trypsin-like peptidase domain-containing protein [Tychonema sp. LEGE 07203]